MTARRVGRVSLGAYVLSFVLLIVSGVVLFYGALGSAHGMVWTSVALSVAAVVGTVVSMLTGRR